MTAAATVAPTMPALIAVIGPVEPDLLRAFHAHYRSLGITDFRLAFHFTQDVDRSAIDTLLEMCRGLLGRPPQIISSGPWHETLHSQLRDRLRAAADTERGPGWHLIADSDEFQVHPRPLPDQIAAAEAAGHRLIGGVLLDRVSRDGHLTRWHSHDTDSEPDGLHSGGPVKRLDAAYPLGGFLTHRLLRGDARKVVLAHSSVPLALGSHRSPGLPCCSTSLVVVHHFKWRSPIAADLHCRILHHTSGAWAEETPAIRNEATRMLNHLDDHGQRIDITDPAMTWRPVNLTGTPHWWSEAAAEIHAEATNRLRAPAKETAQS